MKSAQVEHIQTCGSMFTVVTLQLRKTNPGSCIKCHSTEFLKKAMKKMKNFMITGLLKNNGEACFGRSNDKEFEDFW